MYKKKNLHEPKLMEEYMYYSVWLSKNLYNKKNYIKRLKICFSNFQFK